MAISIYPPTIPLNVNRLNSSIKRIAELVKKKQKKNKIHLYTVYNTQTKRIEKDSMQMETKECSYLY